MVEVMEEGSDVWLLACVPQRHNTSTEVYCMVPVFGNNFQCSPFEFNTIKIYSTPPLPHLCFDSAYSLVNTWPCSSSRQSADWHVCGRSLTGNHIRRLPAAYLCAYSGDHQQGNTRRKWYAHGRYVPCDRISGGEREYIPLQKPAC